MQARIHEDLMEIVRITIAVLVPPAGVIPEVGNRKHVWVNIPLAVLGYRPGIVHALYTIARC